MQNEFARLVPRSFKIGRRSWLAAVLLLSTAAGIADASPQDSERVNPEAARERMTERNGRSSSLRLDRRLRGLLDAHDIRAAHDEDFLDTPPERVELGQLLFYAKELSGNRDISCATCHHALTSTADGLSLSAGVGGSGLSTARRMQEGRELIPRNAPEIFNRGHVDFVNMFWDGRLAASTEEASGFESPVGDELPSGFAHVVEAQPMFPVTSNAEMRGEPGENELADARSNTELWEALADRLRAIDEYVDLFSQAFPVLPVGEFGFEHASRAIAAFEAAQWRADDSPFDRYLRGEGDALSDREKRGAILFYGKAGCVGCHAGTWQTDFEHHAIAMPQIGPGKGHGRDGDEDLGRGAITGDRRDDYAFRTPPLRNVTLTGPYGHAGAYRKLSSVIRHHANPKRALRTWDRDEALLPISAEEGEGRVESFSVMDSRSKVRAIARASELGRTRLSDAEIELLVEFMGSLTDPAMVDLRFEVPARVPSGLPVFD